MRIAVDASYSTVLEPTGIGVYSQKLLSNLADIAPADRLLLCYRPKQFLQSLRSRPAFGSRRLLQSPLSVGADIFHALNQRVDYRSAARVVTTFHDLFVMTSEYSTPEFRTRFAEQARRAAANSDFIIAVSQFTASQVTNLLNFPAERIRIVPHGVDFHELQKDTARENIVLFIGAIQERKNLVLLVRAFEKLPSEWRLVLAGSTGGYRANRVLEAVAQSSAGSRISVTGYLPAGELNNFYSRASIFAFPSLGEGFGIPVLEAMARGLPVLTSNRSALPEVAGDAALLVDPTCEEDVAAGLTRLAEDEGLRAELRARGLRRAEQFSWRNAAELTYKVYREVAGK